MGTEVGTPPSHVGTHSNGPHTSSTGGTLPSALEGLVADVHLENTNYLTQNRVYAQTGRTEILAADPGVIHFGGFELGKCYSTTLHIRNISASSTRLHIIPPSTVYFKAECNDKKGMLAPGMAEAITVEFSPREYRYYHDSVRIHSEGGNLLVPLHGYPIMNETKFPKRVDFNKVEPLAGVVPAHGHTSVTISFEPLGLTTEEMVLEVRVAEFNSKPVRCVVTGSCVPGLVRERVLRQAMQPAGPEGDVEGASSSASSRVLLEGLTMEQLDGTQLFKVRYWTPAFIPFATDSSNASSCMLLEGLTMEQLDGTQLSKWASVSVTNLPMDGMALERLQAEASMRDCRVTGPIMTLLPELPPPPGEIELDGIYVPDKPLKTPADVNYVLNQEPGKLRIKDIKHAIQSKKAEQAAAQEALRVIMSEGQPEQTQRKRPSHAHGQGGHPGTPPLFARQGSLAERGSTGPPALSRELAATQQLEAVVEASGALHLLFCIPVLMLGRELAATKQLEAVVEASGALHLPTSSHAAPQPPASISQKEDPKQQGTLHQGGAEDVQQAPLAGAAFAAVAPSTDDQYTPAWRLIEAADLKKRADNLHAFQRTAWQFIYTRRMVKSLSKIRDVLAQLGWDKQRLAEESANPVLLVSEADRPGTAPTKHLKPDNVRTRPLPLYRDINFTFHEDVPLSQYTDFDELGPLKHKVPLEYRVLGYSPEPFPGLTPYAPPLLEQPLLLGACEEEGGPPGSCLPSGAVSVQDVTSLPSMPSSMMVAPYTVHEIGNRYTLDAVASTPEPSWGMDMDALIQPRQYPFYDSTAEEAPSSGSVRTMRGVPLLSERWLPRKDTWLMQLTPEAVPARMTQMDPADLLTDSAEDADKPAIAIQVCTKDSVPSAEHSLPRPTLNAEPLPPQQQQQQQQEQEQGPGAGAAKVQGGANSGGAGTGGARADASGGAGAGASGASPTGGAAGDPGGEPHYELMRQRQQVELDATKRSLRLQAMADLDARVDAYNASLHMPCYFAVNNL
ncbi:hypothetical protein DUNSADRAFT_15429 [Dunaliella salina]|uniref:Uncharacterized protein n=1 Tax=Dunaliella salina TaxID=3046 RepID=A0ABQ7G5G1_DUNSA|nr:hypothetical protein DUNSADRAFT_15429 [Dunaliella salina]|eukprot:KAF5829844.1 hypothetical protein DUNSADRAFT_15429 [Dunaliella salina]